MDVYKQQYEHDLDMLIKMARMDQIEIHAIAVDKLHLTCNTAIPN